ncbi:alpha-2,8-sialyltransferase 8E isoform X3 [Peromyscus californicus insignis]|uniref:alpha-2,8-sialyltransferase 8E isoform X3 n=1 Tax=Peromyscus californicus insignis TaxID=564181 RepID=UPI0022A702D6|nr:alpha-2,8-sialyltransferase 8E isoform X3 [Peromyscus californicus insignis]
MLPAMTTWTNFLKLGFQFGWQRGDQQANWTGLFNDSDSSTEQSISDFRSRYFEFYKGPLEFNSTRCLELRQEILEVKVLSMVKQSELFDRWKSLQICKWAMDTSEANLFNRSTLSRCCNAPGFLFTTQKNTPIETNLRYEVESSGFYHINQEIFQMFPKEMPYYRSQFKKCAVVGNGGILKNSGCGKEINSADFVFRCNLPPISGQYTTDVGEKTDVVTVNPSIIIDRFHKLEKWRRPFFRVLQMYKNASVLLPAFYNVRNTLVSFRVKYLLDDFGSQQQVYFFHPQYLSSMSRYWLSLGVRAKRISTGLILVTAALELCEEVHLFGFWAFPMNPSGFHITHHYYDNVKPKPGFHAMPSEIFTFLHLHSRGILHVHTGTCNYG